MATIPSNLNFPTSKQIPDHAILDYFNKQTYLGNAFNTGAYFSALPPGVEAPFAYLLNPANSAKSLFCVKQTFTQSSNTGATIGRLYLNPSVVSNGATLPIVKLRPTSSNASVALSFLLPTVTTQTEQSVSITTVADVAGSLNNKYFYISGIDGTTSGIDNYYVWFNVSSGGTDPAVPFKVGVEVDVATGDSANTVATALALALNSVGPFNASPPAASVVTCTNASVGLAPAAADSAGATKTNFTIVTTPGNNQFGVVAGSTATSLVASTTVEELIIIDPGNALLATAFSPAGQSISTSLYWYEL